MVFLLFVLLSAKLIYYLLIIYNEKNNCMCCFGSNDCFPNECIGKCALHGSY